MIELNLLLLICTLIMGLMLFFLPFNTKGWNYTLGLMAKALIKVISLFSVVCSMLFLIKLLGDV